MIELKEVSFSYHKNRAGDEGVLRNVNLMVTRGDFIAIMGTTGSGKSTLIQHMNGLLEPTRGKVFYQGENIWEKDYPRKNLRQKVGLVFQFPEYQLFEETILKDIAFGPLNMGMSDPTSQALKAMDKVGLPRELGEVSPFALSGGQKRLVAIAGILAMNPEALILDEPTAGLDARAKERIYQILTRVCKEGVPVVVVSHNPSDVVRYANRVVVLSEGEIVMDGSVKEVFSDHEQLEKAGIQPPWTATLSRSFEEQGIPMKGAVTDEEVLEAIRNYVKKHQVHK